MQMDFNGLFTLSMVSVIFVFFLVDLFGSPARWSAFPTEQAAGRRQTASSETRPVRRLNRHRRRAALGTSSTTPYVESAAGIDGRTGLTAVTVGVLMLAC